MKIRTIQNNFAGTILRRSNILIFTHSLTALQVGKMLCLWLTSKYTHLHFWDFVECDLQKCVGCTWPTCTQLAWSSMSVVHAPNIQWHNYCSCSNVSYCMQDSAMLLTTYIQMVHDKTPYGSHPPQKDYFVMKMHNGILMSVSSALI